MLINNRPLFRRKFANYSTHPAKVCHNMPLNVPHRTPAAVCCFRTTYNFLHLLTRYDVLWIITIDDDAFNRRNFVRLKNFVSTDTVHFWLCSLDTNLPTTSLLRMSKSVDRRSRASMTLSTYIQSTYNVKSDPRSFIYAPMIVPLIAPKARGSESAFEIENTRCSSIVRQDSMLKHAIHMCVYRIRPRTVMIWRLHRLIFSRWCRYFSAYTSVPQRSENSPCDDPYRFCGNRVLDQWSIVIFITCADGLVNTRTQYRALAYLI